MTPIRFGEDLELDRGAYELRRAGRPVRLERIPMEILLLLIDKRGELVTREEILEKVWGTGVFVDPINSINGAIRKLRLALRDDPRNPRFIGTVTGKGYRFIAPLAESPAPAAAPPEENSPDVPVDTRGAWKWPAGVAIVLLVGAAAAYLARSPAAPSAPPRASWHMMLAVLPFENLTGDRDQDYFSDGLTEEMITRLANLAPHEMGVIARTSMMRYRNSEVTPDRLGRELGVQYVLEGSVRRDGERLRITAQLIQVEDQTHLWAQQFDRPRSDILAVQSEITQTIAEHIGATLGRKKPLPPDPTPLSPEEYKAYDAYLMGRYYLSKRTQDGFRQAIASFEEAVAGNPAYAPAYVGLADSYALMGTYGFAPRAEVISKAREAAEKALALDEELPAAHTSLALISEFYDLNRDKAEMEFRRALELDRNDVTAHHWYAELLAFQGRFDEALSQIESARRLDPLSAIVATDHGVILYFARKYDLAIERFRFVLAMEPTMQRARLVSSAYTQQGNFTEALAGIHEWQETDDTPWMWAFAAYVNGRAGRLAEAQNAMEELELSIQRSRVDPMPRRAVAYIGLGDGDKAIACLQQMCESDPVALAALKVDPIYDPLREDPRFEDLLRCARLSP